MAFGLTVRPLGLVIAGPLSAIGYLVEYLVWTMGIGAVILTWLSTRRHFIPTVAGPAPVTPAPHAE